MQISAHRDAQTEKKRERKKASSQMDPTCVYQPLRAFALVIFSFSSSYSSLSIVLSLPLSSLIFSPRDDTYRLRLFSSKNRFEFAAPKYYDFVSHNSAEGKKNRSKETETAEMYFESEKPSGASRAFCSFYSQRERESLSPSGRSRFPPFWGEGRFF